VVAGAADARLAGAAAETQIHSGEMKGPGRERVPPRQRATLEPDTRAARRSPNDETAQRKSDRRRHDHRRSIANRATRACRRQHGRQDYIKDWRQRHAGGTAMAQRAAPEKGARHGTQIRPVSCEFDKARSWPSPAHRGPCQRKPDQARSCRSASCRSR
jgi:hypothetical protein